MIQLISITVFLIYMNVPAVLVSEYGLPRPFALVVPLFLVVPVAYRVLLRGEALRVPGMIIAALVMLACHTLSALLSERPDIGLESVFSWLLEGVVLAFLLLNALRSRDEVFAAARAIVAAGALMGLLVLLQQILGPRDYSMAGFGQLSVEADVVERVQYRLSGPIGEQNRFAQVLAVLIPLSAGLALAASARQRWLYWIATALIFAGVLLTFSRGTLVALILVLPFALGFGFLRLRHLAVTAICGALLLAVLPFMIAMPYFADRVASIGHVFVQLTGMAPGGLRNTDSASRGRITSMQATGLIFLDHPLLGAGPGMAAQKYGEYALLVGGKVRVTNRRAHNLYLEQAAETGVVGLFAFLGVLWMVLHALNDTRQRTQYSDRALWGLVCGLQLGVLVYMTTSLFLHASYVRYFWLLLALAVAAATIPRPQTLAEFLSLIPRDGLGRLQRESSGTAVAQPMVRGWQCMRRRALCCLLAGGVCLCAPLMASAAVPSETSETDQGIWISRTEVMALPDHGPAWDALVTEAAKPIDPDLSDQTDPSNVRVLARALVAARTGSEQMRKEVLRALEEVQGTEAGARSLSVSRELMAYVIAAELVGLDGAQKDKFEIWLRAVYARNFQGRTLRSTHEERPNNWGTHAGASRLAVAIYLDDRAEIEKAAWVFRGWTGDPTGWREFKFGERWWQPENGSRNYGINPAGARISSHPVGGVLPDDQRRGGPFRWPPPRENYVYEALQGAVAQAVMLQRLGMPAWEWGDRALLRSFQWLHEQADYPAAGDDTWMPHIINRVYGTRLPSPLPTRPGKAIGFADWTHAPPVQ